jgi:hypothetical protein
LRAELPARAATHGTRKHAARIAAAWWTPWPPEPTAPATARGGVLHAAGCDHLNGLVGHFARHVRRWRDGRMLVRWIATALQEVRRSFRRVRGHHDLAALIRVLDRQTLDNRKEVA